jgi:hypothetical protein
VLEEEEETKQKAKVTKLRDQNDLALLLLLPALPSFFIIHNYNHNHNHNASCCSNQLPLPMTRTLTFCQPLLRNRRTAARTTRATLQVAAMMANNSATHSTITCVHRYRTKFDKQSAVEWRQPRGRGQPSLIEQLHPTHPRGSRLLHYLLPSLRLVLLRQLYEPDL